MKKAAFLFVVVVLAPSLLLGLLAMRSLRNQQLVLERQETLLCKSAAEQIVLSINAVIASEQKSFAGVVDQLLATNEPEILAYHFDNELRSNWSMAELGFTVSLIGEVLNPLPWDGAFARQFRLENDRFLCSRESVEVIWQSPKGRITLNEPILKKSGSVFATKGGQGGADDSIESSTQFRQIVAGAAEGTIARFLQDELKLLFWRRSPRDTNLIFGAQVSIPKLVAAAKASVAPDPQLGQLFAFALRDDNGRVLTLSKPGFVTNWRTPFYAAEIGEVLPHWNVSAYLIDPFRLQKAAVTAQWITGLLVAILLAAIFFGSLLIARDLRRELRLAVQKTDFVSNVSHELKTPLTSIRMFSELLSEGKAPDPETQRRYLQIISGETGRLSRLINNVLEFSRGERGEARFQMRACDLAEVTRRTLENFRPSLESNGFALRVSIPDNPVLIHGDCDAIAQVLLNLLSNAEKYSGDTREVDVSLTQTGNWAEISVADRGIGVPRGLERSIFEKFFRAHDSLATAIPGTGLGLTLARQIVKSHGGEIEFRHREGGGSVFIFRLPVTPGPA